MHDTHKRWGRGLEERAYEEEEDEDEDEGKEGKEEDGDEEEEENEGDEEKEVKNEGDEAPCNTLLATVVGIPGNVAGEQALCNTMQ